jgi:hypothetical protein
LIRTSGALYPKEEAGIGTGSTWGFIRVFVRIRHWCDWRPVFSQQWSIRSDRDGLDIHFGRTGDVGVGTAVLTMLPDRAGMTVALMAALGGNQTLAVVG